MAIMNTMGGGPFPDFGVKKIQLSSVGQQLKVNLTVVLKDRGDTFVSWFTKSAKSNMYLKVVQTTDEDAASTILTEKTLVTVEDLKANNTKTKTEKLINIHAALAGMGLKFNTTQLQKYFVRKDFGGNLYEIPIEFEFLVNSLAPSSLQYFFIPKIVGSLLGTTASESAYMPDTVNSLIKREIVLEEGETPSNSKAYLLTKEGEQQAWTGAVHFMDNNNLNAMTGISHTEQSEILEIATVANTKIKDHRVLEQIKNISFSNASAANEFFKQSIFSKIYLSRTYYDTTTGCFSVNINNLLKKHISFSNYFDDKGIDLKDFVTFKSLKLIREKVEIADGQVLSVGDKVIVREFKNLEKAIRSGNSDNKFSTIGNIFDDIKSNNIIKTFDFHDEVEQAEGSHYRYGVEGSLIDLTTAKVGGIINKLSKRVEELKLFKANAEKAYNYKTECYNPTYIQMNSSNKVVNQSIKDLIITLTLGSGPLDVKRVAKFFYNTCSSVSGSPGGIQQLIDEISQTVGRLQKATTQYQAKKAGTTSGSPQKANNTSPKQVKEIKFTHMFKDVVGASSTYYGYEYLSSGKKLSTKAGKTNVVPINYSPSRFVNSTEFLDRAELETEKYYVTDTANNADSFSSTLIPKAGGQSLNPNDSLESTKYTFLTPSLIKMAQIKLKQKVTGEGEKKQISIVANSYDDKTFFDNLNVDISQLDFDGYNDMVSKIVSYNNNNKILSKKDVSTNKSTDMLIKDFFGDASVVVTATKMAKSKNFNIRKVDSEKESSATTVKKDLLKMPKQKESLFMFSVAADAYLDYGNDSMALYDINDQKSAVANPEFSVDMSKTQIAKNIKVLPNQTKSLMFNVLDSDVIKKTNLGNTSDALKSAKNFGAYYMNYKNLVIIEYLTGYELDQDGNPNPKKEIWKELTLARLSNGKIQNTLCRMKRYELKSFNIKKTNLLELPIYDKYFKIVNENFSQTQQVTGLQLASATQEEIITNIESELSPNGNNLVGGAVMIMPGDTSTL